MASPVKTASGGRNDDCGSGKPEWRQIKILFVLRKIGSYLPLKLTQI